MTVLEKDIFLIFKSVKVNEACVKILLTNSDKSIYINIFFIIRFSTYTYMRICMCMIYIY